MTTYRKVVWYVRGLKEYTKKGYEAAVKDFESLDNINLSGKAFMITGANSGIGKEAALEIAKRGGTVHMVCRNEERGTNAQQEIKGSTSNEDVHLHILDMSSPREVQEFAEKFVEDKKPLNVLVNNAGCMVNERQMTEDGLEKNFATNTLGMYMLTTALMDHIKKHESPRIITVTSGGMLLQKLDPDDLQFERMRPFDGAMAYAQNKRQQVVITDFWAKKYPEVHFSTMHPGWADTPAVRTSMPDFHRKMEGKLRTAAEGADTLAWLCISPDASKQQNGGFFQDRKTVKKHLPLAWTAASSAEESSFMDKIEELAQKFRKPATF